MSFILFFLSYCIFKHYTFAIYNGGGGGGRDPFRNKLLREGKNCLIPIPTGLFLQGLVLFSTLAFSEGSGNFSSKKITSPP